MNIDFLHPINIFPIIYVFFISRYYLKKKKKKKKHKNEHVHNETSSTWSLILLFSNRKNKPQSVVRFKARLKGKLGNPLLLLASTPRGHF